MKVFVSWSGERSKAIAESLKAWLPKVIQACKPWISSHDIQSGTLWSTTLARELGDIKFGIICLTRENQHNPWIMFESGALTKSIGESFVVPFIFEMDGTDVTGPLNQYQSLKFSKEDTLKLVHAINEILGDSKLNKHDLDESFEMWWKILESKIEEVSKMPVNAVPERTERDILNELLENTRQIVRQSDFLHRRFSMATAHPGYVTLDSNFPGSYYPMQSPFNTIKYFGDINLNDQGSNPEVENS